MKSPESRKPLFERLKASLEEGIAHAQGEIALKTTTLELPDPPPRVRAVDVIRLREDHRMSQLVFARLLNVSPKTVQSWEQGVRQPSQAALRLIQVFVHSPIALYSVAGPSATPETAPRERTTLPRSGGRHAKSHKKQSV